MDTDIIDALVGIEPGSSLDAIRRQRPQARDQAQASYRALFSPEAVGGVSMVERFAVAAAKRAGGCREQRWGALQPSGSRSPVQRSSGAPRVIGAGGTPQNGGDAANRRPVPTVRQPSEAIIRVTRSWHSRISHHRNPADRSRKSYL
jgi:hypothetical protein